MSWLVPTLRSRPFMKDFAGFLLLLTGLTALLGIDSLARAVSEDQFVHAVGILFGVVISAIIAVMIWRGYFIALCVAGTLLALDTLLVLFSDRPGPSIVARGVVLFFIYRSLSRHRVEAGTFTPAGAQRQE